jgi:hypothetical protein
MKYFTTFSLFHVKHYKISTANVFLYVVRDMREIRERAKIGSACCPIPFTL